ncbi:PA4642 family protein [Alkalimarinus sediminis]|uniref:PA4642 family protein n=1 Tax=Alkalimarinus sediminis TaxID=1632866 RepID=A0A9E8HIJ5_9ALTE|nr:PA4642 family protein [Alkalimarinus sediminis]UZW75054.1 PA4642 family protein [Alkalimarinus sediminis]
MSGPSQPKTVDEDWSDERVKAFLELQPQDDTNPDYHVLIKAYHYMVAFDFARFVTFFVEAGRDINAQDQNGNTILDLISKHASSTAYAELLEKAGAKKSS